MKEPVFQFYVTLTKEDYIRYNRTIVWRYKRSKWMLIISIVLLVLTCITLLLGNLDLSSLSVYDYLPLLLLLLLGWYFITGIDRHAARFFKINKMGGETKLLFFDDCLEYFGPTGAGNGTWQYKDLDSIIVTKRMSILCIPPCMVYVLRKVSARTVSWNLLAKFVLKKTNNHPFAPKTMST